MLPIDRTIVPDVIQGQELATLTSRATVREAASLMVARHVGAVLVVERNRLIGIVTERDLAARVVAPAVDPSRTRLADVMTRAPDTLRPTDSVRDALDLMSNGDYRHLPVVDDDGRLVGIVSIRDLYRCIIDQMEVDVLLLAEGLLRG